LGRWASPPQLVKSHHPIDNEPPDTSSELVD
jgi:hypothetical protein